MDQPLLEEPPGWRNLLFSSNLGNLSLFSHSTANAVRPPSTSAAARQLQEEVSSLRHQLEDARRSVAAMERDHDLYYG